MTGSLATSSTPEMQGAVWVFQRTASPSANRDNSYYKLITKHVYGTPLENRKAVSMFYFVLNQEEWKGHDNGWGLYDEGDKDVIGKPGTGTARIEVVYVDEILKMTG